MLAAGFLHSQIACHNVAAVLLGMVGVFSFSEDGKVWLLEAEQLFHKVTYCAATGCGCMTAVQVVVFLSGTGKSLKEVSL